MAVMPAFKWPLQLHVFEKFVPPKSRNLRDPSSPQRKWWQHAERRDDFRANAGERPLLFRSKLNRCYGRGNKTHGINVRVRNWRHEARQVRWIRKEEKDLLNRESDPAFISTGKRKRKKNRSEETVKEPLSSTQHLVVTIPVSHYDWRFSKMYF
jgi:hypothetical protein